MATDLLEGGVMRSAFRVGVAAFSLCLAGCTLRTGDLNLIATKNIPSTREAEGHGRFEASDCKVFGFPNIEEAIDRAIEKGDGNAMTDAVLYQDIGLFKSCYRAKGTVVKLKNIGD